MSDENIAQQLVDAVPLPVTLALIEETASPSLPIVMVQHLRADTASFLTSLIRAGWDIPLAIAVPYSSQEPAVAALRELGVEVSHPDMPSIAEAVRDGVRQVSAVHNSTVLLHEVGGYFADVLTDDASMKDLVLGVVEETKQGLWRYCDVAGALGQLTVVQIADSPLKNIEAKYVGAAVALSTLESARALGLDALGRPVGLIGYGEVGSACARALRGVGNPVYVHDIDPVRALAARADGFSVTNPGGLLSVCRLIIGCSGHPSFRAEWFRDIDDTFVLASGSSRQVEFGHLHEAWGQETSRSMQSRYGGVPLTEFAVGSGSVLILNNGMPVNFLSESLPHSVIDLVFAQVVAAFGQLAENHHGGGIHGLTDDSLQAIADRWLATYHRWPI